MTEISKEMIEAAKAKGRALAGDQPGALIEAMAEVAAAGAVAAFRARVDDIDIDALAQEIRRVNGNHSLGAGALAEALAPFIAALSRPIDNAGEAVVWISEHKSEKGRYWLDEPNGKGDDNWSDAFPVYRHASPTSAAPASVPVDATPAMVAAALAVDWDNENEEATVHNVWHAMVSALSSSSVARVGVGDAPERIWTCNETRNVWVAEQQPDTTEYVRADLAAAPAPSQPEGDEPTEFGEPEPKYLVGQMVEKVSGYRWPGVIVARFLTQAMKLRYVVECTVPEVLGALHIYSEEQIAPLRLSHKPAMAEVVEEPK